MSKAYEMSKRRKLWGKFKVTKKAMRRDYISPGTTRGEMPRFRLPDQTKL